VSSRTIRQVHATTTPRTSINKSRDKCYIYAKAIDSHPTCTWVFARTCGQGQGSSSSTQEPRLPIDQHVDIFVHVGSYARH